MDFEVEIKNLIEKLCGFKDENYTEAQTRLFMVIPFLKVLGYDAADPSDVIPEYNAGFAGSKSNKVDYVVKINNKPAFLIETKRVKTELQPHHMDQAAWYFSNSSCKFAILTDGIQYQFFSDVTKSNIMDSYPFLTVNMLSLNESDKLVLKKFQKSEFDENKISLIAKELKYTRQIKESLIKQLNDPEDEFVKFFIRPFKDEMKIKGIGKSLINEFRPRIVKAFKEYKEELPKEPRLIDRDILDIAAYFKDINVKELFVKVLNELQQKGIERKCIKNNTLSFRYKGKQFMYIEPRKKFFNATIRMRDGHWPKVKICDENDWSKGWKYIKKHVEYEDE